jgi:hypothetical protein
LNGDHEYVFFHPYSGNDDDDADSYQQPTQKQLSEPASDSSTNEDQLSLSKPVIRPWEQIINNKHKIDIEYEKDVTFHNLDYTKLIQFQSVGLLQDGSHSPAPVQEKIQKCQHCQRVGHMKEKCFDLHPCKHYKKHNHHSNKCFNNKTSARVKNHYGWITSW